VSVAADDILSLIGGEDTLGAAEDLRQAVRDGLPYTALEALSLSLGVAPAALGNVLLMSERTRQRRRGADLSGPESDRLVRIARVASHALRVFGTRAKVQRWLQGPCAALGGDVPLTMLDTDLGAADVNAVLLRIEHGVFS